MQFTTILMICTATTLATSNLVKPLDTTLKRLFLDSLGTDSQADRIKFGKENTKIEKRNSEVIFSDEDNGLQTRFDGIEHDDILYKKESHSNEGVRKQQWHNHPRRLDRIEGFKQEFENIKDSLESTDDGDVDPLRHIYSNMDMIHFEKNNNLNNNDFDELTPLFTLKIRLNVLTDRLNSEVADMHEEQKRSQRYGTMNTDDNYGIEDRAMKELFQKDLVELSDEKVTGPEIKTIYITRGRLPSSQSIYSYPLNPSNMQRRASTRKSKRADTTPDAGPVSKRIFSFWTRLQGLAPPGKAIEHRRHFHAYGSYPAFDNNGDIVSAETRALIRPAGSPLRWG